MTQNLSNTTQLNRGSNKRRYSQNCSQNLWCDNFANIWSSGRSALNFSEHSTVKNVVISNCKYTKHEMRGLPTKSRAEATADWQNIYSLGKIFSRTTKYLLTQRWRTMWEVQSLCPSQRQSHRMGSPSTRSMWVLFSMHQNVIQFIYSSNYLHFHFSDSQ